MTLQSFYFKLKARNALKGNWQTALVVAFFSGIFGTLLMIFTNLAKIPDPFTYLALEQVEQLYAAIAKVTNTSWIVYIILNLLVLVGTPMLAVSCNHYFVERLRGNDLGVEGLTSRIRIWFKSFRLYMIIIVRVFLWSLLLFVPGVIAMFRYSMAPYYLAEDPTLSATEAINKSKKAMSNMKMNYFMLMLSFYGWSLLSMIIESMLYSFGSVVALVARQVMQILILTYQYASVASFYLTVSDENGVAMAQATIKNKIQEMGMQMGNAPSKTSDDESGEDDE